jgi:hypothetical protein
MIAPACFVERAIDHAFGRLGHLVLRNIEILHGRLPRRVLFRLRPANSLPISTAKARPPGMIAETAVID